MYRTPSGAKVRPSGSRCRSHLSRILQSRPELNYLSDSVKTASPPRKSVVHNNRLRSQKSPPNLPSTPSTPSTPCTPCTAQDSPSTTTKDNPNVKSPNAYGYFRQLSPEDQFFATCGSSKMAQFFKHFGDVARCARVVNDKPCGGKYVCKQFVDSGTGNEMTFTLVCNCCKHVRYFGDGCSISHQTQTAQCGHLPRACDTDADEPCSVGKTVLYNFLLAGRGMYGQYRALFGRTGDAYSKKTFDRAVVKCMGIVMDVLNEEVEAVRSHLRSRGQWKTCALFNTHTHSHTHHSPITGKFLRGTPVEAVECSRSLARRS